MTNFFQRQPIHQQPNPEPPGFDLIRQALMNRFFQQMMNPYGLNPGYLRTGPGGNMINPPGGLSPGGAGGGFNPYDSSVYGQGGGGMGAGASGSASISPDVLAAMRDYGMGPSGGGAVPPPSGGGLSPGGAGGGFGGRQVGGGYDGTTVGYAGMPLGQFPPRMMHYAPPHPAPNIMHMMRMLGSIGRPPMPPRGGYDGQVLNSANPAAMNYHPSGQASGFPFYPGGGPNTPNSGGAGVGTGGGGSVGLGGTAQIGGNPNPQPVNPGYGDVLAQQKQFAFGNKPQIGAGVPRGTYLSPGGAGGGFRPPPMFDPGVIVKGGFGAPGGTISPGGAGGGFTAGPAAAPGYGGGFTPAPPGPRYGTYPIGMAGLFS